MTGEVVEFSQWARKLKSDDYCRERALRFRRAELLAAFADGGTPMAHAAE